MTSRRLTAVLFAFVTPTPASAQTPAPIIDMHMHAQGANDQGPAPVALCAPFPNFPAWDQREPYPEVFMGMLKQPECENPVWSPASDDALRAETIEMVERLNVIGVLSGPTQRVRAWQGSAPGRFFAGLAFRVGPRAPSPDSIRALVASGSLEVLAEVTNQYIGIGPDDPSMAEYWSVAEELDLPVGIHMGPGPPGVIYLGERAYRARLSSALLLEDVLARHPRLRLYVMHVGYPFLDDMIAVLDAHPQVHVEVGVIVFSRPRAEFYRYLQALVEAGFEDRIMFGSDHMVWPGLIEHSVRTITEAPFLSAHQKRAILYDNAARFLRLSEDAQRAHWGR